MTPSCDRDLPILLCHYLFLQVVEAAVNAVKHLRSLGCNDIEFSPEDAGRSDPKFLYRVSGAVL